MSEPTIKQYDQLETRCRMLGHAVPFHYCRTLQKQLPCAHLANCWFEKLDIRAFILKYYTDEEIKTFTTPPKPKITSLIDMINNAKK